MEPPDGCEIAVLPGRGRSLVAQRPFEPGALVLRQRPYAWVLQDDQVPTRCDYCAAVCDPPLRCSRCRFARYCGRGHQKAAWGEGHKEECAALCACAPRVPPPTVRLLTRVLWQREREQQQGATSLAAGSSTADGGRFAHVESLEDHWGALDAARRVAYAQMAALARSYMRGGTPTDGPDPNGAAVREAALLLARFAANAHTICDSELRPYGVGLYPLGAMINHGDPPNAVQSFSGASIEFRTLRRVAAGEEVTIAYVEAAAPRLERRQQLAQQYFFDLDGSSSSGGGSGIGSSGCSGGAAGKVEEAATPPAAAEAAEAAGGADEAEPPYLPADVRLWGAAPDWCEPLGPGPPLAGDAHTSGGLSSSKPSGSSSGGSGGTFRWAVLGFGPRPQPPWRQDKADSGMCRVDTAGAPRQPLPGGLLLVSAGGGSDDAATAAAALGPLAAASFELGVSKEEEDAGGQQQQEQLQHERLLQQLQQQQEGNEEQQDGQGMVVLQWGDWGAATQELATAAGRQLQRVCSMQQRAAALAQAGRSGEAADGFVAALHAAGCLPPAVAAAAAARTLPPPADCAVALGPRHVLCQRLLSDLLNAAVSAGDRWPVARAAAEALTPCYEAAYPAVWPNLGLHCAMVAKLQMLLEAPAVAAASAEKAAAVLKVTHASSPVLDEVLRLRYEAEQEARYAAAMAAGGG